MVKLAELVFALWLWFGQLGATRNNSHVWAIFLNILIFHQFIHLVIVIISIKFTPMYQNWQCPLDVINALKRTRFGRHFRHLCVKLNIHHLLLVSFSLIKWLKKIMPNAFIDRHMQAFDPPPTNGLDIAKYLNIACMKSLFSIGNVFRLWVNDVWVCIKVCLRKVFSKMLKQLKYIQFWLKVDIKSKLS